MSLASDGSLIHPAAATPFAWILLFLMASVMISLSFQQSSFCCTFGKPLSTGNQICLFHRYGVLHLVKRSWAWDGRQERTSCHRAAASSEVRPHSCSSPLSHHPASRMPEGDHSFSASLPDPLPFRPEDEFQAAQGS